MKVKVSILLAPAAVLFLFTFSVKAQDELPILETQDPIHQELNLGEDKPLIYDHPSHSSVVKDSVQFMPMPRIVPGQTVKNSKSETHKNGRKDKDEEDALSFNFLYYMFQKFKMSDWIDQN